MVISSMVENKNRILGMSEADPYIIAVQSQAFATTFDIGQMETSEQ